MKLENEIKDLNKKSDESDYELERLSDKAFKLDRQLADTLTKLNQLQQHSSSSSTSSNNNHVDQNGRIVYHNNSSSSTTNSINNSSGGGAAAGKASNMTDKQVNEIEFELEQQREVAATRLHELEKLNGEYQASLRQIEKLKADVSKTKKFLALTFLRDFVDFWHFFIAFSFEG